MNSTVNKDTQDRSWEKIVMRYNRPVIHKSIWQIINSLVPYAAMWYLMYLSLGYPYWITLLLSIPAAGFSIRLFIIFHDCGHGSFFRSSKTNAVIGNIMGILTLTPYAPWHYSHKIHHATSGNLDKRGDGDIWTLTVEEYQAASKRERFIYRMYRNPWIMFTIGSLYMVFVINRFSRKKMNRKVKMNIYFTNIMILLTAVSLSLLIGVKEYLLIQLPVILVAHSLGIWLFYIQHQFDDVYWDRGQQWNYKTAAIEGSSFLKLPSVLQWFTGNIGFHHVHHLSPRIPNYNLARCHYENELFKDIEPVTILSSFRALNLRLWDNVSHRMITFRQLATSVRIRERLPGIA